MNNLRKLRRLRHVAFDRCRARSRAALAVCWIALLAGTASTAQAQAYPIICRGGAGITLEVKAIDFGVLNRGSALFLRFNRGTTGAAQGVAAGTCAWQDRAVSPGEPAALCWDAVQSSSVAVDAGRGTLGRFGISTPEGESRAAFGNVDWLVNRPYVNPGDPGVLMYFRAQGGEVRNERCLLVVHTGP